MILGIHGKKRSGKDTAAQYIIENYPHLNPKRIAFADNIRQLALESAPEEIANIITWEDLIGEGKINRDNDNIFYLAYGENWQDVHRMKLTVWISKFCLALEDAGFKSHSYLTQSYIHIKTLRHVLVFFGTEIGRDMFDDNIWVKMALNQAESHNGLVILPDVRFDNEAQMIKEKHGVVWKVVRPSVSSVQADHRSEEGVSNQFVDGVVFNPDEDLKQFYKNIDSIIYENIN